MKFEEFRNKFLELWPERFEVPSETELYKLYLAQYVIADWQRKEFAKAKRKDRR